MLGPEVPGGSTKHMRARKVIPSQSSLGVSSFKGLVVDLEEGNLVKLAEDGTVLR